MNGFKSLYKYSILHRDVKLENFLVKEDAIKLTDFGLSK